MILTFLDHNDIIKEQPSLAERLHSTQSDFSDMITNSYTEFMLDIKNKNYDMRRLGTPLAIHSGRVTTNVLSNSSIQDYANMSKLVVEVSVIGASANYTISLWGCDTEDGTFVEITEIALSTVGTYKALFFDFYKFYKTKVESDATIDITFVSKLIEDIYFHMHLYKTMENIYSTLGRDVDDFWESKAIQYMEKYDKLLNNGLFYVDIDDNKQITSTDASADTRTLRISM